MNRVVILILSASNPSTYLLVELAEKYLNIFSLIVLFHLSTTHDVSWFSVEYSSTSFLTSLLKNSFPLSNQTFPGLLTLLESIFVKPSAVEFSLLSCSGTIQPYLENTTITVNKYLMPSLYFAKDCMSTK